MTKRIALSGTHGQGKYILIDDIDYEKVSMYRWWSSHDRAAKTEIWNGGDRITIWLHRLIADTPEGMVCDHINGNPFDCRRRNLRNTSQRLNTMNRKGQGKTSQYKGVKRSSRNRWSAAIMLDSQWIRLGYFASEIEAAAAYNEKALELFGEYARLNDLADSATHKNEIIKRYTNGDVPKLSPLPLPSDVLPHLRPKTMTIPLSGQSGKGKAAVVDREDFDYLSQFTWNYMRGYARLANSTKLKAKGIAAQSQMHQLLLPAPAGYVVDHIDGDKLNNSRSNLRLATRAENGRNSKAKNDKLTKSVFKGVFKQGNGWQASISKDYQQVYLGFFATQREAAQAYNNAAIQLHGEFARLNDLSIIDPVDDPPIRTPQKSKFKGVSFHKKQGKWNAYACHNKKQFSIGSYDTEIEAAQARDAYVKEHGLPLRLNLLDT